MHGMRRFFRQHRRQSVVATIGSWTATLVSQALRASEWQVLTHSKGVVDLGNSRLFSSSGWVQRLRWTARMDSARVHCKLQTLFYVILAWTAVAC